MRKIPRNKSRHHRIPRSRNGSNKKSNIAIVLKSRHQAFHFLWGVMSVFEIAEDLNKNWIDPSYRLIVEKIS